MPNGFTPTEPSHATTTHDDLPMPGGATFGELEDAPTILEAMGIPGASAANSRQANADAYAKYLQEAREEVSKQALDTWLQQNAQHAPKHEDDEPGTQEELEEDQGERRPRKPKSKRGRRR